MKKNKLNFQSLSSLLEYGLVNYKNDYPKDFGTAFTLFLPRLFFLFGIALFLMQAAMVNTVSVLGVVCMLTSGYTRLMFGKKTDPTLYLQQNIEDIRNEIEQNFGKFPDVKTYLKDFDDEYARIQAIKAKAEERIKRIKYILYGIIIGAILIIVGIDKPVMT